MKIIILVIWRIKARIYESSKLIRSKISWRLDDQIKSKVRIWRSLVKRFVIESRGEEDKNNWRKERNDIP